MKVYMFQKIEEYVRDYDSEFYTDEELFYEYKDAVKYLEEIYELKIEDIEELYCEERESADDYCEITRYSKSHYEIYMESRFFISFNIHEKTIMNFN